MLSALDRPNSYIGKTVPRPNLERLMQGRGLYVSDINCRAWRTWCSCARPMRMRRSPASMLRRPAMPGVIAVVSGRELAAVITPWVGVLSHLKGLKSAPQNAIAVDRVCWQGEAVAAMVANSRAVAEETRKSSGLNMRSWRR